MRYVPKYLSVIILAGFINQACGGETPATKTTVVPTEKKEPTKITIEIDAIEGDTATILLSTTGGMVTDGMATVSQARDLADSLPFTLASRDNPYSTIDWALDRELQPGKVYRVVAKGKDAEGNYLYTEKSFATMSAPPKADADKLVLVLSALEPLTSRVSRIQFHASKLVMLDMFYMNGSNEQHVETYRELRQIDAEEFEYMFWSSGLGQPTDKLVLYAYSEDGQVIRDADLVINTRRSELMASTSDITATSISVQWWNSAAAENQTFDYVSFSCNTQGWSASGASDQRNNVTSGTITITDLKPGTTYSCWSDGRDHVSGLPIRADNFTITTPPAP